MIKAFDRTGANPTTALDIRDRMAFTATDTSDSEQWGITSFAFDPRFSENPFIYVAYNSKPSTTARVRSHVSRFSADSSRRSFVPASETVLFSFEQPNRFHHIGQLQFGPNERLYIGSGDGHDRTFAQVSTDPRGKILELDVRATPPEVRPYALGMRNPWRFAFDGSDIWVGDVGWRTWEEINRISAAGGNYGWPIYEGPTCLGDNCNEPGLIQPLHYFGHSVGTAVIGGDIYRGGRIGSLSGSYIFGIGSGPGLMALLAPNFTTRIEIGQLPAGRPTGFYRDQDGELFVFDTTGNAVWEVFAGSGDEEPVPLLLSDTGCVEKQNPAKFAPGVIPYDVNQPLWSDGATKRRGLGLPDGSRIGVATDGDFQLPAGTVTIKSFLLDGKLIETRLMMNHPNDGGWRGYSYEWTGSDAVLVPSSGKIKTFTRISGKTQKWRYPSRSQCMQCHTLAAGVSLGLETAQLNRSFHYPDGQIDNQIDVMERIGLFDRGLPPTSQLPALATRTTGGVTAQARAYLHANCSHCHRPDGGARVTIDFRYTVATPDMNVCWVDPAIEDFGIPGAHLLTPGDPGLSIIPVRMNRRDRFGMPPTATRLIDKKMVATINDWIRTPGVCD